MKEGDTKSAMSSSGITQSSGFNLPELALVLLIAGLLVSTIRPAYIHLVDETKTKTVEQELEDIGGKIDDFYKQNGYLPDSLDEVISPPPVDQWGNPYQYLRIAGGSIHGNGKLRKDRNLVPINSDYDLYSMGPDGQTASPLTASVSRDDIVRGRNGDFFGVATDY